MRNTKWLVVSLGLVGGLVAGALMSYTTPTKAQNNIVSNAAQVPTPSPSNLSENPLKLDTPGPVLHYVWIHDNGQIDKVWQNIDKLYWKIEKTFLDGSTQKGIYKNGYYFVESRDSNGKLIIAEKIKQPDDYTGKGSAFDGLKVAEADFENLGKTNLKNREVKVLKKTLKTKTSNSNKEENLYVTMFIDTKYNLPVQAEYTSSNGTSQTQTWEYSYLPEDGDLFTLSSNVTFEEKTPADVPKGGKGTGTSKK